jgi:hypothetical protein
MVIRPEKSRLFALLAAHIEDPCSRRKKAPDPPSEAPHCREETCFRKKIARKGEASGRTGTCLRGLFVWPTIRRSQVNLRRNNTFVSVAYFSLTDKIAAPIFTTGQETNPRSADRR